MRTEAVIVGAGPSGLATAIELGTGVTCRVLEQQLRSGHAPRTKTTHTRTREHLHCWGIAGKRAAASPFGIDYPAQWESPRLAKGIRANRSPSYKCVYTRSGK